MNIFVLSEDVEECARWHVDRHVVKMILEYAQVLSTAHRLLDGKMAFVEKNGKRKKVWELKHDTNNRIFYMCTHGGHPCTQWAMENTANYWWLYSLLEAVCREYNHRYGKYHMVQRSGLLRRLYMRPPINMPHSEVRTPFRQAMPEEFKRPDAIDAYRAYYRVAKAGLHRWTSRDRPHWID